MVGAAQSEGDVACPGNAPGNLREAEKQFDRPGGGQKPGEINPNQLYFGSFYAMLSLVLPINGKRFVPLLSQGRFLAP